MIDIPTGVFNHPAGSLLVKEDGGIVTIRFVPQELHHSVLGLDWVFIGGRFDRTGTKLEGTQQV